MVYSIKHYDGSHFVDIPDYVYDDTTTTLVLFGRGVTNYGAPAAENWLHLLENFAGPTSPGLPSRIGDPVIGQLWYDTMNRKLRVRSPTGNWDIVGSSNVGPIPPNPPNQGDLWLDTSTDPAKLRIYNGMAWQMVTSAVAVGSMSIDGEFKTGSYETDEDGGTYFNSTAIGRNAEPEIGDLWWDYGTRQFKIYSGDDIWTLAGPSMDFDRDTFITFEGLKLKDDGTIDTSTGNPTVPRSDDDHIHFVTEGKERFTILNNTVARFVPDNMTGALTLPRGKLEERPGEINMPPAEWGMIRYNVSQTRYEGFINSNTNNKDPYIGVWSGLGGVIDVDQDTFISAERNWDGPWQENTTPGFDSDTLDFFNRGQLSARIIQSGDLALYSTGFLLLPKGVSAKRPPFNPGDVRQDPTPDTTRPEPEFPVEDGMMRYNTERDDGNGMVEFRIAGSWVGIKNPTPNSDDDVELSSSKSVFFNEEDFVIITNPTPLETDVGITAGQKLLKINHKLKNPYITVTIFDDRRQKIIPDEIYLLNEDWCYLDVTSFLDEEGKLPSAGPGFKIRGSSWEPHNPIPDESKKWCAVLIA